MHAGALGSVGGCHLGGEQAGEAPVVEDLLHEHHLGAAVGAEGGPEGCLHAQEPGVGKQRRVGAAGEVDVGVEVVVVRPAGVLHVEAELVGLGLGGHGAEVDLLQR